jgi:ribosomal-protein-alanine N-acetyltransferase
MSAVLKPAQVRLRPMTEADLSAVVAIETGAYEFPWTENIFRDCLRVGYCCWVAERDAGIEAYGIMSVAAGESHILNLCVAVASQRQGLGRYLLQHLLQLAEQHGAEIVLLEVRPSNRGAIALYHDQGFNEVGVRKGYYPARSGREDAVILAMSFVRR